jgi:hypothetical protein
MWLTFRELESLMRRTWHSERTSTLPVASAFRTWTIPVYLAPEPHIGAQVVSPTH